MTVGGTPSPARGKRKFRSSLVSQSRGMAGPPSAPRRNPQPVKNTIAHLSFSGISIRRDHLRLEQIRQVHPQRNTDFERADQHLLPALVSPSDFRPRVRILRIVRRIVVGGITLDPGTRA